MFTLDAAQRQLPRLSSFHSLSLDDCSINRQYLLSICFNVLPKIVIKMGPKKAAVNFAVGDKVFAKVRGYPAWPARIEECMDAKGGPKYKVFFYGTYESATMKKEELWLFSDETKAKFGKFFAK